MKRISAFIWKKYKFSKWGKNSIISKRKREIISALNPGVNSNTLVDAYYMEKIEKIILFTFISALLVILVFISRRANKLINDQNQIKRNDYGQSSYDAVIQAEYDEDIYELEVTVKEREYREEEIKELYEELIVVVENILKNENESLEHVETNLNPIRSVNDFPFYIYWETSDYNLIHEDGSINSEYLTSREQKCFLKAYFTYENYKFEHIYNITIYPPVLTEKEKKEKEIVASIAQMQDKTQYDSFLLLPTSIGIKKISWKESQDYVPVMVAALLVLALLGIWIGYDNDLAKKYRNRNQLLNLEYAEFVSKLQLLIGSGMTLRTAFERMEADYIESRKNGGNMKYVYEELKLCLKRMHEGAGEEECLNIFGSRCNHIAYKKLVTLLVQNSKKGSSGLILALNNETKIAFEERKQIARRMGEEAQTKLLFPMILMLVVVMIIIMIPAYVSFGI